ncbi:MAG: hypothetical protein GY714_26955 [Desulfobacterales bacterium]|nr:hypothetical protein [Desulfobacterales bacterium]
MSRTVLRGERSRKASDLPDLYKKNMIPDQNTLKEEASKIVIKHFNALNNNDIETFRSTAYLFPINDGKPFTTWWEGMLSLKPYQIELVSIDVNDKTTDSYSKHPKHISIKVKINAIFNSKSIEDDFLVWYFIDSKEYKLACRNHWWLK